MVTIYDIARESGFSVATVSKVYNNYSGVNINTKKKILETARVMGYVPNLNARALVTNNSFLIGVIYKEDLDQGLVHPHFGGILETFKYEMEKTGYDIIFINQFFNSEKMKYLDHCRFRNVDGVLLASNPLDDAEALAIEEAGICCVSVENDIKGIPTVLSDNNHGTKKALTYLRSLGHKKIAMLVPTLTSQAGRERYEAYNEFIKANNLELNDKWIVEVPGWSIEDGYQAADRLLEKCWDDLPTAIFAGYDQLAFAMQSTLLKRGYRVPEDISIFGFDNLIICETMTPTLSTVQQNRSQIGRIAASVMKKRLAGEKVELDNIVRVPTKLIIRDSTIHVKES